ncbi:hypothetical protein D3C80_1418330 [compost metagenome]
MLGADVVFAGLLDGIAKALQLLLIPGDARRIDIEVRLLPGHGLCVRPDPKPRVCQALPGEHRTRVEFAQRRDIAVADDVAGFDVVALDDVLEQDDQRFDLCLGVRLPDPPGWRVGKTRIDDLDTDGGGIEPGAAIPLAVAGMPGTAALVDQLIDGRR